MQASVEAHVLVLKDSIGVVTDLVNHHRRSGVR
jgi:hypothetical protein